MLQIVDAKVTWNGGKIYVYLVVKEVEVTNQINAEAAQIASQITYIQFNRRSGRAGSSWASRIATVRGPGVAGDFGSYGVPYVPYLEHGTRKIPAGHMATQAAARVYPTYPRRLIGASGGMTQNQFALSMGAGDDWDPGEFGWGSGMDDFVYDVNTGGYDHTFPSWAGGSTN